MRPVASYTAMHKNKKGRAWIDEKMVGGIIAAGSGGFMGLRQHRAV